MSELGHCQNHHAVAGGCRAAIDGAYGVPTRYRVVVLTLPKQMSKLFSEETAPMKFIEFSHPEGGRMLVHIDHITSALYRPGEGDIKTRLGLDLDQRQNDVVIFGEEAEQVWEALQRLKGQ